MSSAVVNRYSIQGLTTRISPMAQIQIYLFPLLPTTADLQSTIKMHLEEDDANDLKDWVVIRLKDISDADSDVLADYVLALIRTDTPFAQLKSDVLESLEDFLKDSKQ